MFTWRPKPRGGGRGGSSSASDSGDSPTSTTSQQAQIPAPVDGRHPGQPSSSRRNEPGNSSNPASATSIAQDTEAPERTGRPIQPTPVLDYQPPEFRGLPPPSSSSKRIYNMPGPAPQPIHDEYYTRNELATFKFGSPSITTMTDASSQIDPLSSEDDFPHPGADTTPRPSLAVHTEASHRPVRNDASSTHTFGIRSVASTSTSSLAEASSTDGSQAQVETSPEHSSDDEPRARYYTFPYVESLSSSSVDSNSTRDDFYDDEDLSDPDLEISSARFDDAGSYDQSYWNTPPDQDSFIADYLSQRRGSNPIAIPGVQEGSSHGRDREDSVATVKYPTPSAPGPSNVTPRSPTATVPNPFSLPNNEVEWDHRRRAMQDRIDSSGTRSHPPIHAMDFAATGFSNHAGPSTSSPMTHDGNHDTALEFDTSEWENIAGGIKLGDELGDVDAAPIGALNANFWSRFAPNDGPRRPSIASTINDTFQKHALAFKDQDWSFKKDQADGTAHMKKKRSTFIPFNERPVKRGPPWKGMGIGQREFWRNDLTGIYKVERLEILASENRPPQQRLSIHHYRDGSRQAQRPIPGLTYDPHNGPTTTVHKHSKAAAFSLSRHYRDRSQSKAGDRRNNSSRAQPLRNAVYINGKKTAMILLAPRKVQEAYTSTTTTRKLESHGLLDDPHRSRELDRLKRLAEQDDRLKEKARVKERARQEKEQRKAAEERAKRDKGKGRARGQELTNSEIPAMSQVETDFPSLSINSSRHPTSSTPPSDSLAQAVAETGLQPEGQHVTRVVTPSTSASSTVIAHESPVAPTQQPPSTGNVRPSTESHDGASQQTQYPADVTSGHGIANSSDIHPLPRDHIYGDDEEYIDEEDEQLGLIPRRRKRTPHNEAYHSLSPESIDSFAAQQDNHSRGIFPWLSGRNASSRTLHADTPYHPPWLSAPSRPNNHDMQMQVVAGLNTSFQGVGLLPTDKEIRESRKRKALKNQARDAGTERKYTKEKDIFIDLPDDALYMLLPLWPSETDPVSSRDHPFQMPTIAISDRLYALVYYKPWYPPETGKSKSKEKARRSRGSPTSSQDGIYIDERNVLMSQFYIGARIVTYDDLEGSNVRVPELGLSVMGPLKDAFDSIPINERPPKPRHKGKGKGKDNNEGKEFWDYIIGSYHARDHPMEFYPEGFKKMGLATQHGEDGFTSSSNGGGPSYSNDSVPSGSTAAVPSGSDSINEVVSNNASTSSLPSVSSGSGGSRIDVNTIAPFGEPSLSDNQINPTRFPVNSEEDPIQEPPILLTPIGRAVLEMAFMGALAVTGFSPQPFW